MTPKLRVSIVVSGRFHAFDLAQQLNARGLLERVITSHPAFQLRRFDVPASKVTSFVPLLVAQKAVDRVVPRAAPYAHSYLNHAFSQLAASQLRGATLVHGFSGYSIHALRVARQRGIPTVLERSSSHIDTQTEILEQEYHSLGLRFSRPAKRWLERDREEYELADLIAVPSLFVKRSFTERGIPEARLLHAPFGANLSMFAPAIKREAGFRVVYAGHLSLRKGIRYLIEGFNDARLSGAKLLMFGVSAPETPLLVRDAGQNVTFFGHVPPEELARQYQNASVFVMPSLEEGLAVVQAQALASGLPLICTTNSGGEDLLRMSGDCVARLDGGICEFPAGYIVPVRDPLAIARCLRLLADDAQLLQSKQASAALLRGQGFGWSDYADKVIKGYLRLISGASVHE